MAASDRPSVLEPVEGGMPIPARTDESPSFEDCAQQDGAGTHLPAGSVGVSAHLPDETPDPTDKEGTTVDDTESKTADETILLAPPRAELAEDSASDLDFADARDTDSNAGEDKSASSVQHLGSAVEALSLDNPTGGQQGATGEVGAEPTTIEPAPEQSETEPAVNGGGQGDDDGDDDDDDFGDFGEVDTTAAAGDGGGGGDDDDDDFGDFDEAPEGEPSSAVPEGDVLPYMNLTMPDFTPEILESAEAMEAAMAPFLDVIFPGSAGVAPLDRDVGPVGPAPELMTEGAWEVWEELTAPLPRKIDFDWQNSAIRREHLAAFGIRPEEEKEEREKAREKMREREKGRGVRSSSTTRDSIDSRRSRGRTATAAATAATTTTAAAVKAPRPSSAASTTRDGTAGNLLRAFGRADSPSPARKEVVTGAPDVDMDEVSRLTATTADDLAQMETEQLRRHVDTVGRTIDKVEAAVAFWEKKGKEAEEATDALEQLIGNLIKQVQKLHQR